MLYEVITVNAGSGCTATATWTEPTATDNCSGAITMDRSHAPGSSFNVGTTTVTYTFTDANGNVSNPCSFNVTVVDNVAPTAVCKSATIYLNSSGVATLTAADINNGSSDNCTAQGNLMYTLSKSTFSCSDLGDKTVTLTVRDASGNTGSCDATVTVADNIAPTLTATAGTVTSEVNATANCQYTISGSEFDPVGTDNCSTVTLSYTVTGATTLSGTGSLAGKILNKGANLISWRAEDGSGNDAVADIVFTKTVVDNQAPVVTGKTNQAKSTDTGQCYYTVSGTEFDASATDNCGVTSSTWAVTGATTKGGSTTMAGEQLLPGINNIVWTFSDGTNSATTSFRVTVSELQAPVISVINNITTEVDEGECTALVTWTVPTATVV